MNWDVIISAVTGLIAGGGISWIFKIKGEKAQGEADAVSRAAEAMEQLLDNIKYQQELFNNMLKDKDLIIANQQSLIEQYKKELEDAKDELKELKDTLQSERKKIEQLQRQISNKLKRNE